MHFYLYIFLFFFSSFLGIFASGQESISTPLLAQQKANIARGAYEFEEGRLTIKLLALTDRLVEKIEQSHITELILKKEKADADEVLPTNELLFIAASFPNLSQLTISGFIVLISTAHEFRRLKTLTNLNARICKLGNAGITCLSSLENLTQLYINDNDIGDEGTILFRSLPNLISLGISGNNITDAGLVNFEALTQLQKLNIAFNKLGKQRNFISVTSVSEVKSAGRGIFTNNASISYVHADISEIIPRQSSLAPIAGFKNLTNLSIVGGCAGTVLYNFLMAEDLSALSTLTSLTTLTLGGEEYPPRYHFAGNIRDLRFHPRPLSGGGPSFLEPLIHLKELIAVDSGIEDEGLKSIGKMTSLEKLNLSAGVNCKKGEYPYLQARNDYSDGYPDIKLSGIGLQHIVRLTSLRILKLEHQPIGNHAVYLGNLTSLTYLELSDAMLTEDSISTFPNLVQLTELYLRYNKIGKGTRHLSRLTNLQKLDLSMNERSINDEAFGYLISLINLENLQLFDFNATLTPHSIPNIITFIKGSKVKHFEIGTVYLTLKEKQQELHRERTIYRKSDYNTNNIKIHENTPVWTKKEISRLLEGVPTGFNIDFGQTPQKSSV